MLKTQLKANICMSWDMQIKDTTWSIATITVSGRTELEWRGMITLVQEGSGREEIHDWCAISKEEGQWDIAGKGGYMASGKRTPDTGSFPFSLFRPINKGVEKALSGWLEANKEDFPVTHQSFPPFATVAVVATARTTARISPPRPAISAMASLRVAAPSRPVTQVRRWSTPTQTPVRPSVPTHFTEVQQMLSSLATIERGISALAATRDDIFAAFKKRSGAEGLRRIKAVIVGAKVFCERLESS